MKHREQIIGFSQRIQLDWLEYTANLVLTGNSRNDIVAALRERLRDRLSVGRDPERGNREKAITILTKVWVNVPEELGKLRDEGLQLLQQLPTRDHILVHWCMCMAVYPFFGTVAEATGRLLRLQGTAAASQVQRRVREQLGERETVSRAARRILRVFVDWAALVETDEKGIYQGYPEHKVDNMWLISWVIEAQLVAKGGKPQPPISLVRGPQMFPFDIASPAARYLENRTSIDLTRHGLDHEIMVCLKHAQALR